MDIRQATVSLKVLRTSIVTHDVRQVDDLLGMQNANLLNLPENYTFKYCMSRPV